MKRALVSISITFGLLVACTSAPTATPVPVGTSVATATMLPASTPTGSPMPTVTRTNTPLPTATREPEVPRLEELSPSYFFTGSDTAQLNKNNDNWIDWYKFNTAGNGSYVAISEGTVQFIRFFQTGTATGSSKQVRAELDATGPTKDGNIAVQLDFRVGPGIPRGNYNLLTTAGPVTRAGQGGQLLANVNFDENLIPTVFVFDPDGDESKPFDYRICYASDIQLTRNQWHNLELSF